MKNYLFCLSVITTFLSGCSEKGMADLETYVENIKAIENPQVDPIPEYRHIAPYFYEVQNMRDPFLPLIDTKKIVEFVPGDNDQPDQEQGCPNQPNSNRVRVGLEDMPIDALQMIGTLNEDGTMWALVVSKGEGTIYKVKQGDYIGENEGEIVGISEDQIDVLELLPDGRGCWTHELTTIRVLIGS